MLDWSMGKEATEVDTSSTCMHRACMATKTISVDMEAYKILRHERKGSRDSFSQVIRRLYAAQPARTFGEFIEHHESELLGRGFGGPRRRAKTTAA